MKIGDWYVQRFSDETLYFLPMKEQKNGGYGGILVTERLGSRARPKAKSSSVGSGPRGSAAHWSVLWRPIRHEDVPPEVSKASSITWTARDRRSRTRRDALAPPSSRRVPQTPGAYRFAVTTSLIREHRMTDGRARALAERWERMIESRRELGRTPSSTAEHVARYESQHIVSPYPKRDYRLQTAGSRKSKSKMKSEKPIDKEALLRAMNRAGYDVMGGARRKYAKRIVRRSDGKFIGEMDAQEAYAWLKQRVRRSASQPTRERRS